MVKSSSKISNIGLFFLGNFGWVTVMAGSADELGMNTESEYSFSQREQAVQRARKIVNSALFEAIKQGSLDGVAFLIERGADLSAENKQGRTPLDFAEYLAEKYPEEPEWQVIVDVLNNWDSEQYAVDDATVIATARKIWGLSGGGKAGKVKKAAKLAKKAAKASAKAERKGTTTAIYAAERANARADAAALRAAIANKKSESTIKSTTGVTKEVVPSQEKTEVGKESGINVAAVAATVGSVALNFIPGMGAINAAVKGAKVTKAVWDGGRTVWNTYKAVNTAVAVADTALELSADRGSKTAKPVVNQSSSGFVNPPQSPKNNPKDPKDKDKKPSPEASKPPRIVNTPEDCKKYIDNKISSKTCQKDKVDGNKQYFKIIKKDGILKKGDYIYKDTKHHEIELMKSDLKIHKGAIDPKTGNLYKEGVPGRNIKELK
jgi:hypothetical protein